MSEQIVLLSLYESWQRAEAEARLGAAKQQLWLGRLERALIEMGDRRKPVETKQPRGWLGLLMKGGRWRQKNRTRWSSCI